MKKEGLLLVVGAALILAAAIYLGMGGGARRGPPSSSYTTGPSGLAAYAELLAGYGHPVEHLRGALTATPLDPGSTLVVLDAPTLAADEARRLRRFLEQGGRLVAGGEGAEGWMDQVIDEAPRQSSRRLLEARPLARVPEVAGVRSVRADGPGSWAEPRGTQPVLGQPGQALAVVASPSGKGRLVALADASPLQNRLLGEADNAAFGLGVVGEPGRPVRFAEGPHGYGRGRGLAALPWRWRLALAGLAGATAVWLWARTRRLGPPELDARPLPPPRRAFVDAVAATLARTGRPGAAAAPVKARARDLIARRAGLGPEASTADLRRAAGALGLPEDETEAVLSEGRAGGNEELVAAGRALARLSEHARGGERG